jgi:signal peptidase I
MGLIALVDSASFAEKFTQPMLAAMRNALIIFIVAAIIYLCFLNFPVSLTLIVFVTGIIVALDYLFFAKKRAAAQHKPGTLVKNSREFFLILLIVWVIRSFIIQPYHVPSGSLQPTITPGDFIVAKQYSYGLRFPIGNFVMIPIGKPKTGDIVLFYNPTNPTEVFIKRLIGTPGDLIEYKNKVLFINGVEAKQQFLGMAQDEEPNREPVPVEVFRENLNGRQHNIFVHAVGGEDQDFKFVVPPGAYFMMGDNRDDSDDSRTGFGSGELTFVPERNLIGKGLLIWMSWDPNRHRIVWNRIGKSIR